MIRPSWICDFRRHVGKDGKVGTRWDLAGGWGPAADIVYKPLHFPLKRAPFEPVIYLNRPRMRPGSVPDPRKPCLGLYAPDGRTVTGVFEPSAEHPGRGFGDVARKDALLIDRNDVEGSMSVYVFPGLGLQALSVFLAWIDGGIDLTRPDCEVRSLNNNGQLTSNPVAPPDD